MHWTRMAEPFCCHGELSLNVCSPRKIRTLCNVASTEGFLWQLSWHLGISVLLWKGTWVWHHHVHYRQAPEWTDDQSMKFSIALLGYIDSLWFWHCLENKMTTHWWLIPCHQVGFEKSIWKLSCYKKVILFPAYLSACTAVAVAVLITAGAQRMEVSVPSRGTEKRVHVWEGNDGTLKKRDWRKSSEETRTNVQAGLRLRRHRRDVLHPGANTEIMSLPSLSW